jgi:glycosyltransferase involved in cell wall biosynthesis
MKLRLEITPLAINKTAMYHIVRDTVKSIILAGYNVELSAVGIDINLAEYIANDYKLNDYLINKVQSKFGHLLAAHSNIEIERKCEVDVINIIFDPLYLLFVPAGMISLVYVLDLTPITRPKWHNEVVSKLYKLAFSKLYNDSIKIISISKSTSRDLWANLGLSRASIVDVNLYERFKININIERGEIQKRLLFVGSLEVRKNIIGLIKGFERSGLSEEGYSLRIVGGDGHGAAEIKEIAKNVDGVKLLGRIDDEDLLEEYKNCAALVYPSFWEGFGLPVLEALSRGIPLLLSDSGAVPEVAGDFGIYIDPCNINSISDGMRRVVNFNKQKSEEYIDARSKWLAEFSFDAYITKIFGLINQEIYKLNCNANVAGDGLQKKIGKTSLSLWGVFSTKCKLFLRKKILDTRILPASLLEVPGNSFTFDYLYLVQQEQRIKFSAAFSKVRFGKVWLVPYYLLDIYFM